MKLLVIDDDFEAREAIKNVLMGHNLEILFASDAVTALLKLKDNPDTQTVISDYRMPGLGGKDWIDLLMHYHPNMKIIVVSGYDVAMDKLKEKNLVTIKKPFDKYQLMQAVGI